MQLPVPFTSEFKAATIALITLTALAMGEVPRLKLNRAGIAMIGAGLMLLAGVLTFDQAERTIDLGTLVLLFSMMVINAVLELAGFFTWIGEKVIERAHAPLTLLALVVFTAGALSTLFLNDPVCIMLTPLVCGVVLHLGRKPEPYLIALACAANVGSVATITGNPQNIVIGASSGIGYVQWLIRLGPVALVGLAIVFGVIWLLYPQEFRNQRSVDAKAGSQPLTTSTIPAAGTLMPRAQAEVMIYILTLRKSLVVIILMLIAFLAGVNITTAAFVAACVILISRRFESARILALVDWPLLVMFGGLFVVTGALELTGVSVRLFDLVKPFMLGGMLPLAAATTLLSNIISNVPAVLLLRPMMAQFPDPTQAWLTLAAASTLAGNLTLTGSVANLIVAEQARKFNIKLTFGEYLKAGVVITVLTLLAAVMLI
ncbi:MAG: anion transporter [Thermoflexales bacterium]